MFFLLFRLPTNLLFLCHIILCAYLFARKFKEVNPTISYSVFRISSTLSFPFLSSCFLSYIYILINVQKFIETSSKIKKAIIAAFTPGLVFPITAITKYIVLRKCSEIISPDRAFVLCYYLRGSSILLYRTMQSGFEDIRIFLSLSFLHGVSNIISKATLHLRIKIWKIIITCYNKMCCRNQD